MTTTAAGATTAAVLLVETSQGDVVAVRFSSADAARLWEDAHADVISVAGCVTLATKSEALELAR